MAVPFGMYRSPGATRRSLRYEQRKKQALDAALPLVAKGAMERFRDVEQRQQPPARYRPRPRPAPWQAGMQRLRTVEQRQQPAIPLARRLQGVPRPSIEARQLRQGRVFPDPALRGTETFQRQERAQQAFSETFETLIRQGVPPDEAAELAGRRRSAILSGTSTFTLGEQVTPLGISPPDVERARAETGQLPLLEGVERFRTRVTAPYAASVLQLLETRAGATTAGGVAGTPLRTRPVSEVAKPGVVQTVKAWFGDEKEQARAQQVLEEAGLIKSLVIELVADPTLLLPIVGFGKLDDFARGVRAITRLTGRARVNAIAKLRESETFQQALRGVREASEAGGARVPGGRFRPRTPEGVQLTNDIPTTTAIRQRLAEIDAQLAKPRVKGGRKALLEERAKVQAQKDIDDIVSSGRPVEGQLDMIQAELSELQTESRLRSVPFSRLAREAATRERFPELSIAELDARERVFREFVDNAKFEPVEEPLVGRARFTETGGVRPEQGRLPVGYKEQPAPAETPWAASIDRLASKLDEGTDLYKQTKIARSAELKKRTAAALEEARTLKAAGMSPEEIYQRTLRHYKGVLPDVTFVEGLSMTPDELTMLGIRSLDYMAETGRYHTGRRALNALKTMVEERHVPRPHEVKAIREVYGDRLADALAKVRAGPRDFWDWAFEVTVMPKSILSTFDVSFPARQGFWVWGRHPVAWADSMRVSAKIWKDPKFAEELTEQLLTESTTVPVRTSGRETVEMTLGQIYSDIGIVAERVEPFLSPLAERLPLGVGKATRRSQLAFTTAGNKLRTDIVRFWITKWVKSGVELNPERLHALGNLVNALTGRATFIRGNFWKIFQAAWWSPQYRLSFPQAIATLFRNVAPGGDLQIARVAAEEMVTTAAGTIGILAMLKMSGLADVNLDPRSTDFGKIKMGPTRINFFGTSQLLVRSIAQLIKAQRLDPELGPMPIDRGDVALRYFRSGLAPEWSAAYDYLEGKTYLGERLRPSELRGISASEIAKRELFNRLTPMAWRDIVEAVKEDGIRGAFVAPTSLAGVSVQSYKPTAANQLQTIPEFKGEITQRQIEDIEDFLGRVNRLRHDWRENFGRTDIGVEQAIRYVGEVESLDPNFIEWAVRLRYGSKSRADLRNPEWIAFVTEHADVLRKERPDLLNRNYITDALREKEAAGVR